MMFATRFFFILSGVLVSGCGLDQPALPQSPAATSQPSPRLDSTKVVVRKLTPDQTGLYTLKVRVGDRVFSPVVDTGSSDLLVPGEECNGCSGNVRYMPSAVATENERAVEGEIIFGTGRAGGRQARDRVGFSGTKTSFAMDFYVIHKSENLPAGGLLGLAYPKLSTDVNSVFGSFVDGFSRYKQVPKRFALLLCEQAEGISRMIFGDERATGKIRRENALWIPVPHRTYYTLPIESMHLAGAKLGEFPDWRHSDGGSDLGILDSGANGTWLPPSVASALKQQLQRIVAAQGKPLPPQFWQGACKSDNNTIMLIPQKVFETIRFPEVELELVGGNFAKATELAQAVSNAKAVGQSFYPGSDSMVKFKVPAHAFFLKKNGFYSYAVCPSERDDNKFILGQPFLEHFLTVFDRQRHIIGFTPSSTLCRSWQGES